MRGGARGRREGLYRNLKSLSLVKESKILFMHLLFLLLSTLGDQHGDSNLSNLSSFFGRLKEIYN